MHPKESIRAVSAPLKIKHTTSDSSLKIGLKHGSNVSHSVLTLDSHSKQLSMDLSGSNYNNANLGSSMAMDSNNRDSSNHNRLNDNANHVTILPHHNSHISFNNNENLLRNDRFDSIDSMEPARNDFINSNNNNKNSIPMVKQLNYSQSLGNMGGNRNKKMNDFQHKKNNHSIGAPNQRQLQLQQQQPYDPHAQSLAMLTGDMDDLDSDSENEGAGLKQPIPVIVQPTPETPQQPLNAATKNGQNNQNGQNGQNDSMRNVNKIGNGDNVVSRNSGNNFIERKDDDYAKTFVVKGNAFQSNILNESNDALRPGFDDSDSDEESSDSDLAKRQASLPLQATLAMNGQLRTGAEIMEIMGGNMAKDNEEKKQNQNQNHKQNQNMNVAIIDMSYVSNDNNEMKNQSSAQIAAPAAPAQVAPAQVAPVGQNSFVVANNVANGGMQAMGAMPVVLSESHFVDHNAPSAFGLERLNIDQDDIRPSPEKMIADSENVNMKANNTQANEKDLLLLRRHGNNVVETEGNLDVAENDQKDMETPN